MSMSNWVEIAQFARFGGPGRTRLERGEPRSMLRSLDTLSETDLERALLRKGVQARDVREPTCGDCGRRPLIGESMYRYGRAEVCELCRTGRAEPPSDRRLVLHVEHGISVRRLAA